MALYKPTFLSPDNIGIDGDANYTFTWETNGDAQTDFQLYIYDLDNNLVYDSTKITSATASHVVPLSTLTNGTEYKWYVKIWASVSYVSSDWVGFDANTTPTISIDAFADPLPNQNYTFTATYTQAESVPVKSFEFILYDASDVEVTSSGLVYDTTVEYEIVGMLDSTNYKIECNITTQNGMTATSGKTSFSTDYDLPDTIPELTITENNTYGYVTLSWANLVQVLPVVSGSYSYVVGGKFNKGIQLDSGTTMVYSETIPEDFTMVFFIKLPVGFTGTFLTLGTDFYIGYDGTKFTYTNQFRNTASQARALPADFFLVGIKPSEVIIKTTTYEEVIR